MKRSNKLKVAFVLIAFASLLALPSAMAKSWPSQTIEDAMKPWKVTFNAAVQPSSLTSNSVYILDGNKKIDAELRLINDGKTVEIKPVSPYEVGKEYELRVETSLKSVSGKPLKETASKRFSMANDDPIQSISQTSGLGITNFVIKTRSDVYKVRINTTEMKMSGQNEYTQAFFETLKPGETVTIRAYSETNKVLETKKYTISN